MTHLKLSVSDATIWSVTLEAKAKAPRLWWHIYSTGITKESGWSSYNDQNILIVEATGVNIVNFFASFLVWKGQII